MAKPLPLTLLTRTFAAGLLAATAWMCVGAAVTPAMAAKAKGAKTEGLDPELEFKLKVLAGHPDIKPGTEATKVAAWAWSLQHVIEQYDADHLRVNFCISNGQVMLPYGAEYTFAEGRLVSYDVQARQHPPALDDIYRQDRDGMAWIAVDRSLWGYAFRIPATWRLLQDKDFPGEEYSFRFTVIALPTIYDKGLKAWIENSLQWCVFRREKPFAEIHEVIAAEEQRLEQMGTEIVHRTGTDDASGFVYETVFQGNTYLGKSYFMISEDGAGFALRFNATPGTYALNLARFERFAKGFILTRERIRDSDLELIRKGNAVLTVVGGVTAQDLEGVSPATVVPGGAPE